MSEVIQKALSMIKVAVKKPYIYVPPCPCCLSKKTGQVLKSKIAGIGEYDILTGALKNGELVCFLPNTGDINAFCYDCGYVWHARTQTIMKNSEEIRLESEIRGTMDLYRAVTGEKDEKGSVLSKLLKNDSVPDIFALRPKAQKNEEAENTNAHQQ